MYIVLQPQITSAFKEYWGGGAETDYFVTIQCSSVHSFCIQYEPAVPVMSLHCTAQHQTSNTQALKKFSVTPISIPII